jgi:hypothetical protein
MMLYMMSLMFAFLALNFPSGLSLYWVANSIFRVILQYRISGWGGLVGQPAGEQPRDKKYVKFIDTMEDKGADEAAGADIVVEGEKKEEPKGLTFKSRQEPPPGDTPGKDRAPRRRKK